MMLNVDFMLRLLVAGILGAIIGLDREYRAKEAGYRTHFLVSLGSALIMIVSQYGFQEIIKENSVTLDPSRVAAQVVSGIGFIGAGTIILQKQIVRGLTTAAGIWATAGIGLAVGAGMYTIGIATTVLTLIGLELLSYIFKSVGMKSSMISFSTNNKDTLKQIADRFNSKDYMIVSYEMETQHSGEMEAYQVTMVIKSKRNNDEGHLLSLMQKFPDVTVPIHDFAENLMRFVCALTAFQCFFHMHHGSAILSMCFILRNGLNVHRVELHYLFEDSMDFVAGFTCLFSSLYVLHSAFITMLAVRISRNFKFRMHIIHLASFDYNHNIHYIAAIRSSTYLYFSHLKLALFCSRMQALGDNFVELLLPGGQHSRQSAFIYNLSFNIILFCNSLQQLLPCQLHFFSADKRPQMLV